MFLVCFFGFEVRSALGPECGELQIQHTRVKTPCGCAWIVRGEQHYLREYPIPSVSIDGHTPRSMLSIRRANGVRRMERMAFRAQSIVADVALAALAFALAYLVA